MLLYRTLQIKESPHGLFFLSHCMIDQFAEHYYIAKSYGLVQEFVDTYRFFRRQGVARPFAAYYAAKEWDL